MTVIILTYYQTFKYEQLLSIVHARRIKIVFNAYATDIYIYNCYYSYYSIIISCIIYICGLCLSKPTTAQKFDILSYVRKTGTSNARVAHKCTTVDCWKSYDPGTKYGHMIVRGYQTLSSIDVVSRYSLIHTGRSYDYRFRDLPGFYFFFI